MKKVFLVAFIFLNLSVHAQRAHRISCYEPRRAKERFIKEKLKVGIGIGVQQAFNLYNPVDNEYKFISKPKIHLQAIISKRLNNFYGIGGSFQLFQEKYGLNFKYDDLITEKNFNTTQAAKLAVGASAYVTRNFTVGLGVSINYINFYSTHTTGAFTNDNSGSLEVYSYNWYPADFFELYIPAIELRAERHIHGKVSLEGRASFYLQQSLPLEGDATLVFTNASRAEFSGNLNSYQLNLGCSINYSLSRRN